MQLLETSDLLKISIAICKKGKTLQYSHLPPNQQFHQKLPGLSMDSEEEDQTGYLTPYFKTTNDDWEIESSPRQVKAPSILEEKSKQKVVDDQYISDFMDSIIHFMRTKRN
jgi:hypothetical protein